MKVTKNCISYFLFVNVQSARLGIKPSVAYLGAVNINYLSKEFIYLMGKSGITNCLRGIRNAWHFYYALV
ncbi:hypothetical protein E2I22_08225 [Vibrio vulnificus]|nr:hypothetical protein E2I22_08225 [Vibrio vulnificus]